ncbi:MAG: aldo/keto reductase [Bacteroidetes bacterium]|nr:MAG: aldo/keto reductase [Bacteroidota bacterium]
MKKRKLGNTGLEVSEIGFGAWAIGGSWGKQSEEDSQLGLETALDRGVNFIDTAAGYGNGKSERIIGEFLKSRSERIFVCTKTPPAPGKWPPSPYCKIEERYSEKYLRENVEERMKNLQVESLDVLLLHTWTRAWNDNPVALKILQKMKAEGLIKQIGISTPEHDQNCVVQLMRDGMVDVLQVIYNIFEQEPAAQLFPVAQETGTGIIVRVAFDEGVLTGKYTGKETFGPDDFRSNYFAGDRLARGVRRTEKIKKEFKESAYTMPELALKFALSHEAVSTVIPGIRNQQQAIMNTSVSELPELSEDILIRLREHSWNRGFWYGGK